jgi:hypothetical protein
MSTDKRFWCHSYSRRAVLSAVSLASLVSTSGCLAHLINQGISERERNVVVKNTSGVIQSVMITMNDPNGERLFHWHQRIKPGRTMIAGAFHGLAHTIIISVGNSDPRTAEYVPPTGDCNSETITVEILDGGVPQIHSRCGDVSRT